MKLMEEVTEIFRMVFDIPELIITEKTNALHIDGWDSVAQINLIITFEEKYNLSFTTEEISRLTCVGDMLNLLQAKGAR